jgi:hypothetical protein
MRGIRILLILLGSALVLAACGQSGSSPKLAQSSPSTSSTALASIKACTASELKIQYRGTQGATGNWASAFWIADGSALPCALRSTVTVQLVDSSGGQRVASKPIAVAIPLSAHGVIPSRGKEDVSPVQKRAALVLFWPTLPNAILELGGTPSQIQCPQPSFVPKTARFIFNGGQAVTVSQLSLGAPYPSSVGTICGSDVSILELGPLT